MAVRAAIEHADAAEQRLTATLERIRAIPGFEHYWMHPSIAEIRAAATPDPVLYIWTSKYDTGIALVLADGRVNGRICHVLEMYFVPAMSELLTEPWQQPSGPDAWRWGPVTLIVSGLLSYLPVHAWPPVVADADSGAARLVMPLTYAPSARQAQTARRAPRPAGSSRRLLSLADPEIGQPGFAPLPCARLEAAAIAGRSPDSLLIQGAAATRAALLANLPDFEVVHLACHGTVSTAAPD